MSVPQPAAPVTRDLVLAVDDNEQNLLLLEEYLTDWGYDVQLARDGAEAIDLLAEREPSIIVLDVMMPVLDGYETCRRIKSQPEGRTLPILMLTALTAAEDKIRALDSGADDFLNKPINREELRARIRSLIRIRSLRRELDCSENIVLALSVALENKDPRSFGHVQRVADLAVRLADKIGMRQEERDVVFKGAMLHDLGMIGISESLLGRRDLDVTERAVLAGHTVMGASILSPMTSFRRLVPIVRSHHELLDGSGYPDGLVGEDIPLEAQIVAIANRFDEIAHEKEDPLPAGDAFAVLEAEAARGHYDRELVHLFGLAIREEQPRAVVTRHLAQRPAVPARVLCVDDTAANRELIAAALEGTGFQVLEAADGRQALALLEDQPVDAMLLDLNMPEMDGTATLRALRQDPRYQFLPVIVVTSHRSSQVRQEAIVAGADDFISQPVNRLELITRIHSLLRIKTYHADLEQTQSIICALALTLEAKDPYTRGHSQRVGDLARAFALFLGKSEDDAERARMAGLLHDIGKIAVPQALLNKQGPLTRDEFMRVIDHPVIGEEMVRPLMTLAPILAMIRHHHERYDGRGYPDGLRGEAIPFDVRLLSIVDAYDALTSHRAYRPAPLSHEAALATLHREAAGGKWDPDLVQKLTQMLGDAPPDWDAISIPAPTLSLS